MRVVTFAGAVAAVALAAACSPSVDHVSGLAQPVTGASGSSPATAASTAAAITSPSSPPATTGRTSTGKPEHTADPCPASAATLFHALRTSEIYGRAGNPDGLAKPNCYQGFAYARSTFRKAPQGEIPWILFGYDAKGGGGWRALNLGTGDVCAGYVSQTVRDHLNQGTGGGC